MKVYLDEKIDFASKNPKSESATLIQEICEMTKKMHKDKAKLESDKRDFFKVRQWVHKNTPENMFVIKEQEEAILTLRKEIKEDKKKYSKLNSKL